MAKRDVRRTCADCGNAWTVPRALAGRRPLFTVGGLLTGVTSLLTGRGSRAGQLSVRRDALSGGSDADDARAAYAVCGRCSSDGFTDGPAG